MKELLMNAVARVNMFAAQVMPMTGTTANTVNNLVKWAGTIAGALIAVFLIYSIAKDALAYVKGSGDASIFKIITKVIFLLFCIGLVVVAQNYSSWMNTAAGVANSALNGVANVANELMP